MYILSESNCFRVEEFLNAALNKTPSNIWVRFFIQCFFFHLFVHYKQQFHIVEKVNSKVDWAL